MDINADTSTLQRQRDALRSFLAIQQDKVQMEAPVGPDRSKAEGTAKQQAESGRRTVSEDRQGLERLQAESRKTTNELLNSITLCWNKATSMLVLDSAGLKHLVPNPESFKPKPGTVGDPAQALRNCHTAAVEARDIVESAIAEYKEFKERRLIAIAGVAFAVVVIVAVLVGMHR